MPKTIFIPGASGFLGTALVREATHQGHHVRGLSRSDASDAKITAAGGLPSAAPSPTTPSSPPKPPPPTPSSSSPALSPRRRRLLRPVRPPQQRRPRRHRPGPPPPAPTTSSTDAPTKALIVASTALITAPDPTGAETTEKDPEDPTPFYDRASPSRHALAWASRGLRVATIRLAPAIYGPGDMIRGMAAGMAASPRRRPRHRRQPLLAAAAEALAVPVKPLAASEAEPFLAR
ncbi:unnamed protein product [Parascedosporium putredinis]|uniref:NAD-dependent epimerase/dehydratase domain-containing protein n=1 Tax=Parascedosporium putredinis TaxID=1442378 RepID=A0A9P1HBN1_9PEZI|nr:unnamed protein product [Parascedosporium putredinis]CAI8004089.1 unnamed protein product [Parascedosporium putredinis]